MKTKNESDVISPRRRGWLNVSGRYRRRGGGGLLEFIARSELRAAALLWDAYCVPVQGWTLDLGAGAGGIWLYSKPPPKMIAIDFVPQISASATYPYRLTADAADLPISPDNVQRILALGLLEYLVDLDSVFKEWRLVCTIGARLLLTNSTPTLPNRIRQYVGQGATTRLDSEIEQILTEQGWRVVDGSRRTAGWQSLFVAEAVILPANPCSVRNRST